MSEQAQSGGYEVRVALQTYAWRGDVERMAGRRVPLLTFGADGQVHAPPDCAEVRARMSRVPMEVRR